MVKQIFLSISICDQIEDIIKKIFNCETQTHILTVHHTLAELEKTQEQLDKTNFISAIKEDEESSSITSTCLKQLKNYYSNTLGFTP